MKQRKRNSLYLTFALSATLSILSAAPSQALDQKRLFEQVQVELKAGTVSEKTLADLQSVAQAEPTNSQAHLYLGLVLDQLGLNDAAAEQFELSVRYGADNPMALVALCKEEIRLGRIEPAVALLNEGLKKFPNNAEMLYLVGDYLFHNKSETSARVVLERAYGINPDIEGLPTALGQAILELNPLRAGQLASIELGKRPGYEKARYVRGFAYKAQGRHLEAAQDLQIVFDRQPMLPPVNEALSQLYYWLGDYDKALKPAIFLSLSTSLPNAEQSGSLPNLMRILVKIPRNTIFQKINKITAELALKGYVRPDFFYVLGKAYDQLDMPSAAMLQYRHVIEMDPSNARAYYRLALNQELYSRDYQAALENYQQAYNLRPWDQEITIAYMRLQDRMHNRSADIAWKLKDWLNKIFN